MSRWIEQFKIHPFQEIWQQILDINDSVSADNISITTDVEEIARYRKVVVYINELIQSSDPELVPVTTWQNFLGQCQNCLNQINAYQSSRNIEYIKQANISLDNLLSYISPYVKDGRAAAKASTIAFKEYEEAIKQHFIIYAEESKGLIEQINSSLEVAKEKIVSLKEIEVTADEFKTKVFGDDGVEQKVDQYFKTLSTHYEKAAKLYKELFDGISGEESIETAIKDYLKNAETQSGKIDSLLEKNDEKLKELNRFYNAVYGQEELDGSRTDGLKKEIETRREELDKFKENHELKYNAFVNEIESLVSGATSAGLAKAYYDLKNSFSDKIRVYSRLFYGAITGLLVISLFSLIHKIGWLYVEMVDTSKLDILLPNIVNKLPFILPILWLAIFASKRRSEADRLQQEYAHKEAIAKSYENFKKQIKELGESDPELMKKLLGAAIDAISENASHTLDKKHGDNSPLHELVEKVVPDLEKLAKVFPKA